MISEIEKLQGTWNIAALEVEGSKMDSGMFIGSKIIVKGSSFTTVSMGAAYSGTLNINAENAPKTIDLKFTEGPEKGNTSAAIYELDGDNWKICLGFAGKNRPTSFTTKPGSGHALETLKRERVGVEAAAPNEQSITEAELEQTGGQKEVRSRKPEVNQSADAKKELALMQGEWSMVSGASDGMSMPEFMTKTGKRMVKGSELTVTVGGQVMMKNTIAVDPSKKLKTIDYIISNGPDKGKRQYGIYELKEDEFRSCFAPLGKERPKDFSSKPGDGRILTAWKRVKK